MNIVLIVTTFFTGIMAGLFFAWTISVMNGLAKLPDKEFILSMQSMNREIQNPIFFIFFFGTAILLPTCAFVSYRGYLNSSFWLILIPLLLYLIGVMMVTIFRNIPLNNMLDSFVPDSSTVAEIDLVRRKFETPWNRWNLVRTFSSMLSFVLLLLAMIKI